MKTWHKVAIAIIAIVGVLVSVKSCVDRKTPDLTVAYIGHGFVDYNAFDKNAGSISHLCNDINNDGEINIDIMEISFNDSLAPSDRQNSQQKLANAVGMGAARLYFIEEDFVVNNASSGVFADISTLGDGFRNSDGEVVAISIKGNEKVQQMGIDTDCELYLAVRIVSEMDVITDKTIASKNETAINIAKYILN